MCSFVGLREKRACMSPYRPKDYLAASGYTICDDGRRQADAYFSAQTRKHTHDTKNTKNATAKRSQTSCCCVQAIVKQCVVFAGKRARISDYRPEDYLAASEYKICDDGRRQAGAYLFVQARNKHTTQRTQKRDGQRSQISFLRRPAVANKCMF